MEQSIAHSIRSLMYTASALNKSKNYVNFYRLWLNQDIADECGALIAEFIKDINSSQKYYSFDNLVNLVIISPDNIGGNLGVIPITFTVAKTIGCKKVAIWQEFADLKWGTPSLISSGETNLDCIILQDVVDKGTVAIKIAHAIKELKWNLRLIVAVVLNPSRTGADMQKTISEIYKIIGYEPDFKYIMSMDYLLEMENENISSSK